MLRLIFRDLASVPRFGFGIKSSNIVDLKKFREQASSSTKSTQNPSTASSQSPSSNQQYVRQQDTRQPKPSKFISQAAANASASDIPLSKKEDTSPRQQHNDVTKATKIPQHQQNYREQQQQQQKQQQQQYQDQPQYHEQKRTKQFPESQKQQQPSPAAIDSSEQAKITKSKQLSAEILSCSSQRDLIRLSKRNTTRLGSEHLAMIFFKFFQLGKFQTIYEQHARRVGGSRSPSSQASPSTVTTPTAQQDLFEIEEFTSIYERIRSNLDNMNPDSLNLILRAIGMKQYGGRWDENIGVLLEQISTLLLAEKNILLFSELQLFYFLKYMSNVKPLLNSSKTAQKVALLALNKIAPALMQFKRGQLTALLMIALNLELFETSLHEKLTQAILKRYMYLSPTDFSLLFQYNALHYATHLQHKLTDAKLQEKSLLLNRIINYMAKRDIIPSSNLKNLFKLAAHSHQLDFLPEDADKFLEDLAKSIPQEFAAFIERAQSSQAQQNRIEESSDDATTIIGRGRKIISRKKRQNISSSVGYPVLLADALAFFLKHPIVTKQLKFLHCLRSYVRLEMTELTNVIHVASYVQTRLHHTTQPTPEELTVLESTLFDALTRINSRFTEILPNELEALFEVLDYENCATNEDAKTILTKSIKYICQVNFKLDTTAIVKIAQSIRRILNQFESNAHSTRLSSSSSLSNGNNNSNDLNFAVRFYKNLKTYAFSEFYTKFEEAVRVGELRSRFTSARNPAIDIEQLQIQDTLIDQLEFTDDLEKIESQIKLKDESTTAKLEEATQQKKNENQKYFFEFLGLTSLADVPKSRRYQEYIDIIRRQTHCINSILLSQIVFANEQTLLFDAKDEVKRLWKECATSFASVLLPEMITVDNINSLILSKQLFELNGVTGILDHPSIQVLIDVRLKSLKSQFETRKKAARTGFVKTLQAKYKERINKIEECVLHGNCLIDIVISTSSGERIAIIAASKLVRKSSSRATSIHARTQKVEYLNSIRKAHLLQTGFQQVHIIDTRETNEAFTQLRI